MGVGGGCGGEVWRRQYGGSAQGSGAVSATLAAGGAWTLRLVKVELGDRSYQVTIAKEVFASCASFLQAGDFSGKALLVTDEQVNKLYADSLVEALVPTGFVLTKVVLPCGEQAKSLAWADRLYTAAIEAGLDRKSPFIALGGGVTGDLTGFAAATYMRGVPFIQLPTTLLAQTDASVGGKVAINHPQGKNMIGAFHQPAAVFAATEVLKTLAERDYASGLAEVVKYACLDGDDWLAYLEENRQAIWQREQGVLAELILRCCEYKARIVAADEREGGLRMVLNLGHTYGHAVEAAGGFSVYTHGEAVAIGLHGVLALSRELGLCGGELVQRVCRLLEYFRLPLVAKGLPKEEIYENLWHDKKATGGKLTWVLLKSAGQPVIEKNVDELVVRKVLDLRL